MEDAIKNALYEKGVDIVRFVDISGLGVAQTQGFQNAIVFCIALTKSFVKAVRDGEKTQGDEFVEKEHQADALADWLAADIQQKGYRAYSQSEASNERCGMYDEKTRTSNLPHKTIARLAGLGFIGKNNLLINDAYGCAFSMCTVLTDAPLKTDKHPLVSSQCGQCAACKNICPSRCIYGKGWSERGGRDAIVDIYRCTCPLLCMVHCPFTLQYALRPE